MKTLHKISFIWLVVTLVACSAPTITETLIPVETVSGSRILATPTLLPETPALELLTQKAIEALAHKLGLPSAQITLVGIDSIEWSDDCLEIYMPGQACTEGVISGYRLALQSENVGYEYRSNQDGSILLFAGPSVGSKSFPVLIYRVEGGIAGLCDHIEIFGHGKATFHSCGNQRILFELTDVQLRSILTWINHYTTFEYFQAGETSTDQATITLIFSGNGAENIPEGVRREMQLLAEQLHAHVYEQMGAPVPTGTRAPEQLAPDLAGLLFTSQSGLWQVEADGTPRLLFDHTEVVLSSDGEQVVSMENDDLWITNIGTGETVNLTHTPDRAEYLPLWSSARPEQLFFLSYPLEMEIEISLMGFLTMIHRDGSGYRILDEEERYFHIDLSPDGNTIAYGQGQTAWLYHLDTDQPEPFIPAEYGLPEIKTITSPSWSPDGKRLAWVVQGEFIGVDMFGIAMFDLETHSARVLHPYRLPGTDVYPGPGVWSPDGNWLAYLAHDEDISRSGTWVLSTNSHEEIFIGGGNPVWKPDGNYLLISNLNGDFVIVQVDSWLPTPIQLPEQTRAVMDWR